MATLPSPTQVAGSHSALYEAYWNQVDPNGQGTVGAIAAARFLKRSGLSDVVLSRVWDLSDPGGRGSLDKAGFFVALKLVSVAQIGKDLNMVNCALETPPPKMGDPPPKLVQAQKLGPPVKPPPPASISPSPSPIPTASLISGGSDWSIKPNERAKYDQLFDSLQPLNGMIPGNKVKGVLMESKLQLETLGKIWDLADYDKDGMLDRHEFVVAMHLVYKALEKHAVPATLPPELMKPTIKHQPPARPPPAAPMPSMQSNASLMHDITPLPQPIPQPIPVVPQQAWVVDNNDKLKYDAMFIKADVDRDGYVNGFEIKDVFLQSGVSQAILAHIWALCDIKQTGKLNNEQFALAMWMVNRKLQGIDPPGALTADMFPPSMRSVDQSNAVQVEQQQTVTPYSNPELDMISKDIDELAKEKLALETDIAQKEADIKIKGGEIKSLQSELDTLTAALKQLENQKGEAQKRLNDLRTQRAAVDTELADILPLIDAAQEVVDKLRAQAEEQEAALRGQEGEVSKKREQLESLRQEQAQLETQKLEKSHKLNNLGETLTNTQLQISQARAKITQLEEQQRLMKDAINACDYAIENSNPSLVSDGSLRITPEFRDPQFTQLQTPSNPDSGRQNDNKPYAFSNQNGFDDDEDDPFAKSDPFNKSASNNVDPFTATFNNNSRTDPFDPFGDNKSKNINKSPGVDSEKDPFGCDPFAILHAPTRESVAAAAQGGGDRTSPTPALPPKKGKTPPPRPAPPRPSQPISQSTTPDPFSAPASILNNNDPFSSSGGGGFADFANFDAKFSKSNNNTPNVTTPQPQTTQVKLDFTDDPFRDYRYEDPFNISDPFDEDDEDTTDNKNDVKLKNNINNKVVDAFGFSSANNNANSKDSSNNIFSDDFDNDIKTAQTINIKKKNHVSNNAEDEQLAWAAAESMRIEEERKRRYQQEQADFEYALALSKAETKT